jgi:hypothetical protein
MIQMNELEIIRELTDLIVSSFSEYLVHAEEEMPEPLHLPPLRYIGTRQNLPPTMTGPHLLIELETAEPTIKDRIIKQTVYYVTMQLREIPQDPLYFYVAALKTLLEDNKYHIAMTEFLSGTVDVKVTRGG